MDAGEYAQWQRVKTVCKHLRYAAKILDDVCSAAKKKPEKSLSEALRRVASDLEALEPKVKQSQKDGDLVDLNEWRISKSKSLH